MHNSYYILRQLGFRLKQLLSGSQLISCYSQDKDELVMHFEGDSGEHFIHAVLRPDFSIIRAPDKLTRARKNSASLFQEIGARTVLDIYCFENERCLCIELDANWQFLLKMFGSQSNVILCENFQPRVLFKSKQKEDLKLTPATMNREFIVGKQKLVECQGDFTSMLPTLGGAIKKHIEMLGYREVPPEDRWSIIQKVLSSLEHPTFYIHYQNSQPALSMFRPESHFFYSSDVIEALNEYFIQHLRYASLNTLRKTMFRTLGRKKKKAKNTAAKCQDRLAKLEHGTGYREIADLIMAHMHAIPPGATSIELPDFNTGDLITIKLKSSLSPQKNAEAYYRKSKNQQKEIKILNQSLRKSEEDLQDVDQHIAFVDSCNDPRLLLKYQRTNNLISENKSDYNRPLFKEFHIQDYLVLVGRNAHNNDLLTQKQAHKDDLWLHAKDVKGSHVIIKHIPGRSFPASVIEKAAQLAAYYSKRKNDTLCPVIYTEKKYVRKPKGAAPGLVIVEREQVLLVTPETKSFRNSNFK